MGNRSHPTLAINGVLVDLIEETLRDAEGEAIALRPQTFAVLRYLALNPNRLVTKDELMGAAWPGTGTTDHALAQSIREIRSALRDDEHAVLKTLPRRGFELALPIKADSGHMRRIVRHWPVAASFIPLLLVLAVGAWWPWPADNATAPLSVAVMPFDASGGNGRDVRLADAFSEDLIVELSRSPSLKVIARSSVEAVDNTSANVRQIADDLDVRYVLEGNFELQPTGVRVTAQLIDASTGALLWTERYDRQSNELVALRDVILARLVGTLTDYDGPVWIEWIAAAERRAADGRQDFDPERARDYPQR